MMPTFVFSEATKHHVVSASAQALDTGSVVQLWVKVEIDQSDHAKVMSSVFLIGPSHLNHFA